MIRRNISRKITGLFAISAFVLGMSINAMAYSDVIAGGVSVSGVDIGGLSVDEATARVQEYVNNYAGKTAQLKVDDNVAMATIGELGYYWKNTEIISDAASLCKKGNIIKRYKDKKDLSTEGKNYEVEYDVNDELMRTTLDERCSQYNIPHVNASITRSGGEFTYTEGSVGRIIDTDVTVNEFHQFLLNTWDGNDAELTLRVVEDVPTANIEDCQKVTDLLGSYTTTYSTGSSNYNRNQNIANGARLLGDKVLYPGEIFSANSFLEPWTEENGWREAGTYVNGKVEDSLGGGICQVSTTLYNAVIKAELEIVERYPHSMSVGYVPLSQDAALAGTYKDLKFCNNTDTPIYIESLCGGGSVTFNVYGMETRDPNRRIEFVSETLNTIEPSEVITEDSSQPVGYRSVSGSGHVGYNARLIKKVYENGELVSEDVFNKSSYAASPIYVTVGTGGEGQEGESESQSEGQEGESQSQPEGGEGQEGESESQSEGQEGESQSKSEGNGDNTEENTNGDEDNNDNQGDNQNDGGNDNDSNQSDDGGEESQE